MRLELNPTSRPLSTGWRLVITGPDAAQTPHDARSGETISDVPVPGTVAEALEKSGGFDRKNPVPLDNQDAWYFLDLEETPGPAAIHFGGLATICDVFFNGELLLQTDSMFLGHVMPVLLSGNKSMPRSRSTMSHVR